MLFPCAFPPLWQIAPALFGFAGFSLVAQVAAALFAAET
jgi:hypothetical protein